MLHMSEYLTSKEQQTYLHLENTTHSSLLWLSQKGLVFRVLWTMQCFPLGELQGRAGDQSAGRWCSVTAGGSCGHTWASSLMLKGRMAACTFPAGEGLIHNTSGVWFHGFFVGEGRRAGTELPTLPYETPLKTPLSHGPRSSLLKLNNKKGTKETQTMTLIPLVSYWDVLGLPPHTFSCIAATDPSWRRPSVPLALVRRGDWLEFKPLWVHQSALNNHKNP